MAAQEQPKADHLAVLIHGFWGNPNHLDHLRSTLRKQHSEERLHILVAKSNSDNHTYDGIEVGGERIVYEIEQEIAKLEEQGHNIKKISITGYSLGGLIARYAIGLMYSNGLFERIQPINFATFVTPHLGVRTPQLGYRSYVWNFLGARTLSTSGQQLFLVDNFRGTERNLIELLADSNSIFIKGLSLFRNRWIYANTLNDRSVPYYTAMISRTDPYRELDKVEVHYAEDQPSPGQVLLEPSNPVTPRKSLYADMTVYEKGKAVLQRTSTTVPFYLVIFSLLPLALPLFMINAAYQTYHSAQRVRHHESGQAFKLDRYRVKLLEEAQAVEDKVYQQLAQRQEETFITSDPPASGASTSGERTTSGEASEENSPKIVKEGNGPFPILALKQGQFDMIDNLDRLGFTKYPVHIQRARHTHAAVVFRSHREDFSEGKVVVQHWAEKFDV